MYLSLHCHHQNDSCIKMGSDESYLNVSLTVRDKVTRQCPQTTTFLKPNALPLGQTGSQAHAVCQIEIRTEKEQKESPG